MSDNDLKKILSKNLNRLLLERNKQQNEVAKAIGVNATTFNTWCNGISVPRSGALQALADYFGVLKSELIDEVPHNYYLDAETREYANEIKNNKELRMLFDASRNAKKEDLEMVCDMLTALKKREQSID